jgi:hypothetical protein
MVSLSELLTKEDIEVIVKLAKLYNAAFIYIDGKKYRIKWLP